MTVLQEIAAGVHILRHKGKDRYGDKDEGLDVTATLVVGGAAALVVDTLGSDGQARELLAAVRRVTDLPLVAVNTHHHAGHSAGNAVFAAEGAPIWGHEEAAVLLRKGGGIRPPDRVMRGPAEVELGGRVVHLRHFGRAHTAGDLVVLVPDADVAVVGDLVEPGGPGFVDAFPLDWPDTLAVLRSHLRPGTLVVPGHGKVVDAAFVRQQHDQLAALAWLIRDGDADGAPAERVAEKSPIDRSLLAVRRGYSQLSHA